MAVTSFECCKLERYYKLIVFSNSGQLLGLFCSDVAHNEISLVETSGGNRRPFRGLSKMHDLHMNHNNISEIREDDFEGLHGLEVL